MSCCDRCRRTNVKLIEVNESSWTEYAKSKNIQALSWKSHVCGQCLVGKRIPVFRPSIDKWQIGEVKTFHWQTQQHVVLFDENDRESVDVSSSPFHDYVSHCKEIQVDADKKEAPCQARLADMESIATCSPIRYKFEGADNLVFRNDEFFYERGSEKDNLNDTFNESWMPIGMSSVDHLANISKERSGCEMTDSPNLQLEEDNEEAASSEPAMKACPRLWSEEEDRLLLDSIDSYTKKDTLKWPDVAKFIAGRTGKQCRERYLNHLKPNIRHNTDWSPKEDAQICHQFFSIGSKWTLIAKLLRGRSDNAVKNRYHFIRRKLQKLLSLSPPSNKQEGSEKIDSKASELQATDSHEKLALVSAAVDSILALRSDTTSPPSAPEWSYDYEYRFGPFYVPAFDEIKLCQRCALIVPSRQTGSTVCRKTGWCHSCTKAPPYIVGKYLGKLHDANSADATDILEGPRSTNQQ